MACIIFSGKAKEALERFKEATGRNRRNVYPAHLFSNNPVFPHYGMYRKTILDAVDADTLRLIREGPDIRALLSRPPRWMGPRTATLAGIAEYLVEKKLRDPVHPTFGRRMGFTPRVVSVRQCETASELADLILASSCTPPSRRFFSGKESPFSTAGLWTMFPSASWAIRRAKRWSF